jgi:hypothetical protein
MITRLVAVAATLSLPLGAASALAQPEDPPPTVIVNPPPAPEPQLTGTATVISTEPQYETVQDSWNAPVFTSGLVTFGVGYGAAVIGAATQDRDERERWADRLYVPVVGPWLALNDYGPCPIANPECDRATSTKVLLIADGIVQAGGVITMVTGLVSPSYHRRVVSTGYADTKVRVRPSLVGSSGHGMTVFGRF